MLIGDGGTPPGSLEWMKIKADGGDLVMLTLN